MTTYQPNRPYNDLPKLPPSTDIETRAILRSCIASRAALAEMKQAVKLLPNPLMLINTIPVFEAKASSEIENIVTTADRLFRYADHESRADPATKEALRYRTALFEGYQELQNRPFSMNLCVKVCQTLRGIDLDIRNTPGTLLINDLTGEHIYTPPEGKERLQELLRNIDDYLYQDDGVNPLIKMAIMHYQFESIHPFTDGNGRTGRIMNLLYLHHSGLLELPCLYLSGYIIKHKASYYKLLQEVTKSEQWEEWVLYMLTAVEKTALWTIERVQAILDVFQLTIKRVKVEAPEVYSRELIEVLFNQPYCRIVNVVDAGIAKRETAAKYLRRLVDLGILHEITEGKEKLFINQPLLRALMAEMEIDTHADKTY